MLPTVQTTHYNTLVPNREDTPSQGASMDVQGAQALTRSTTWEV